MSKPILGRNNSLEQWRTLINRMSHNIGDPESVYTTDSPSSAEATLTGTPFSNSNDTYVHDATVIEEIGFATYTGEVNAIALALNDLNSRKIKRSGDTISGNFGVTGITQTEGHTNLCASGTSTLSLLSPTVALGTNGLVVETNVLVISPDTANANVGIGAPATAGEKLEVTGNSTFTGNITNVTGTSQFSGNVTVDADILTSLTTFNLLNTTATTMNFAGDAITLNMGNTTGPQIINVGSASVGTSTYNFGTGATTSFDTKTVNIGTGGAADSSTNVNIGDNEAGNILSINTPNVIFDSTSPVLSTTETGSLSLFDTTVTTIKAFGEATSITIGDVASTMTLNLGTGATTGPNTKTINIGTGGVLNSSTNINIGDTEPGNTTTIFTPNVVLDSQNTILSTTSTGDLTLFDTNIVTLNAFSSAGTVVMCDDATSLTINNTTGSATINIATGVTANTETKTVNVGTGGGVGSTTNINIGDDTAGTTTISSPTVAFSTSPTFTSASGTATIFDSGVTTVNAFSAATAITLGATTGTFTIDNANFTISSTAGTTTINSPTIDMSTGATGVVNINSTLNSTATTNGALVVDGGAGIASDVHVGGTLEVDSVTAISATTDLTLAGNGAQVHINDDLLVTGTITATTGDIVLSTAADTVQTITSGVAASTANLFATDNTATINIGTGSTTGSVVNISRNGQITTVNGEFIVANGNNATVGGDLTVSGGDITIAGSPNILASTVGNSVNIFNTTTGVITIGATASTATIQGSTVNLTNGTGVVNVNSTANSTSTTTGALVVDGGAGIANNVHIGGSLDVDSIESITLNTDLTLSGNGTGIVHANDNLNVTGNVTVSTGDIILETTTQSLTSGSALSTVSLFDTDNTATINMGTGSITGADVNISRDGKATVVNGSLEVANGNNATVGGNAIITGGDITLGDGTTNNILASTAAADINLFTTSTTGSTVTIGSLTSAIVIQAPTIDLSSGTGAVNVNSTADNTLGTFNGALVVDGGASVAKNMTIGADLRVEGADITIEGAPTITGTVTSNAVNLFNTTTGTITVGASSATVDISGTTVNLSSGTTGVVNINSTKEATVPTDGALVVDGGVGIGGNLRVGGNLELDLLRSATNNTDLTLEGKGAGAIHANDDLDITGTLTVSTGDIVLSTGGDTVQTISSGVAASTANLFATSNTSQINIGTNNSAVLIGGASQTTTVNGNLTVAANKNLAMSGTGTFTTGTGDISLNGNVVTPIKMEDSTELTNEFDSVYTTTATTAQVAIATFSASTYAGAEITISTYHATGTRREIVKLLVSAQGTTVDSTVYGYVGVGTQISTYDADYNTGNIRILATADTTDTVEYRISMNKFYA